MLEILKKQAESYAVTGPVLRPGYTVRVHQKIQEAAKDSDKKKGGKKSGKDADKDAGRERIQIFEGLVIAVHKGRVPTDSTVTVRKLVDGIGVEKVFSLLSPSIDRYEVVKIAKVRRAKLFFLRGRFGKAGRLQERFIGAEETKRMAKEQEAASASAEDIVEEKAEGTEEEKEV